MSFVVLCVHSDWCKLKVDWKCDWFDFINEFWPGRRRQCFIDNFSTSLTLRNQKVLCGFARKNPTTFDATKGTKRAKSKTSSILCLLGMDRCGAPIWLSMRSTSHKILEMWWARINLVVRKYTCTKDWNKAHKMVKGPKKELWYNVGACMWQPGRRVRCARTRQEEPTARQCARRP